MTNKTPQIKEIIRGTLILIITFIRLHLKLQAYKIMTKKFLIKISNKILALKTK